MRLAWKLIVGTALLAATFAPGPALAQSLPDLPYGVEPNGSFPAGAEFTNAGNMYFSNGQLIQVEKATSCSITNAQARFMAVRYYDPNSGVASSEFPAAVVQCVRWWPEETSP
jgi:hypothetical protein